MWDKIIKNFLYSDRFTSRLSLIHISVPKEHIKDIKVVETVLEGNINNIDDSIGNNKVSLYLNSKDQYHFSEEEIENTYGCSHGNSLGNYVARVWSYNN